MKKVLDYIKKHLIEEYVENVINKINEEQQIINAVNEQQRQEINLLRREIGVLRNELEQHRRWITADILRGVEQGIANSKMNELAFSPFKNNNTGGKIVICGAGPTLNDYIPIEDAVHIAVNRAFLFDKVQFDYIFAQDFRGINLFLDELREYKGKNCVKFFGTQNGSLDDEIPESYAIECNAVRYSTDSYIWLYERKCKFSYEINSKSLGNFSTIAMPAMQFALWTNPAEIYLVGFDSDGMRNFTGENSEEVKALEKEIDTIFDRVISEWKAMAEFASIYYPNTKIYSINPVKLKGLFNDIFQHKI